MNNVNKTLYIPLYGKALVSRKGLFLHDSHAEAIWEAEGFALRGKSRSKWLAYYMGMRAAVFDRWVSHRLEEEPAAVVLHLGCGLDSRCCRVERKGQKWYDVDFPEVIAQRRRHFRESETVTMLGADIRQTGWLEKLPGGTGIVVMEGISMYLRPEERKGLLEALCGHFETLWVMMDCYTEFAARASKVKNPINDVGVTQVYGLDDPKTLEGQGLHLACEGDMTPKAMVDALDGWERRLFRALYAGGLSRRLYRLYVYRKGGTAHDPES